MNSPVSVEALNSLPEEMVGRKELYFPKYKCNFFCFQDRMKHILCAYNTVWHDMVYLTNLMDRRNNEKYK